MKKLKLQMQLSVDGFVSSANGKSSDWMVWDGRHDLRLIEAQSYRKGMVVLIYAAIL